MSVHSLTKFGRVKKRLRPPSVMNFLLKKVRKKSSEIRKKFNTIGSRGTDTREQILQDYQGPQDYIGEEVKGLK